MAPFKDSFDQYENENYFDTFLQDNNDQKKYFEFRPLVEDKKLYRDFNQDNPHLEDADLEKAVRAFQGIALECKIPLAAGAVKLKSISEKEKTIFGYPDSTKIHEKYKPLGQHRPKREGFPFIDIDWDDIKARYAGESAKMLVVVLLHEYMHELMSTENVQFSDDDAYYVQKEEALANALTLKALDLSDDKSLFEFALGFMAHQPQRLGYRYGIEIFRTSGDKTIDEVACEWKQEKEGARKPSNKEKEDFYRRVMAGIANN